MLKPSDFSAVYSEMAQIIGVENTILIYDRFKGQQVSMPQRLYSAAYVEEYVRQNYNGRNVKELAQKFQYSERRIRQFLGKS